ncbi:hypothetical protein PIB30_041997 [Stylosanthes scabra]|uniref:Uncharacterized protein n=1 Tax=Stylosanthes scabra TaxID=79078 RepID=A0ABU6QFQ4_9FABA|nr:hypothetical protein [Stylosanthes scabra]
MAASQVTVAGERRGRRRRRRAATSMVVGREKGDSVRVRVFDRFGFRFFPKLEPNRTEPEIISTASSHGTAARPLHRHRRAVFWTLVVSAVAPSQTVPVQCPPLKPRPVVHRGSRAISFSDRIPCNSKSASLDSSLKLAPPSVLTTEARRCAFPPLSSVNVVQQQEMEPQFDIGSSGNNGEDINSNTSKVVVGFWLSWLSLEC